MSLQHLKNKNNKYVTSKFLNCHLLLAIINKEKIDQKVNKKFHIERKKNVTLCHSTILSVYVYENILFLLFVQFSKTVIAIYCKIPFLCFLLQSTF